MSGDSTIETRTAAVTLRDDGIIEAVAKEGSETGLADAKENLAAATRLAGGKPFRFLVDASATGTTIDAAARRFYMSDQGWAAMSALALVIESRVAQPLVDVLLRVCSRGMPMRAFLGREQAVDWLQRVLPLEADRGPISRPSLSAVSLSEGIMDDVEALESSVPAPSAGLVPIDEDPLPATDSRQVKLDRVVARVERLTEDLRATTATRDFFESVLHTMDDAVVVVGIDGSISMVNDAATRLLGYEAVELIGHDFGFIFRGQESPALNLVDLNREGRLRDLRAALTVRDGSQCPVSINAGVIPSTDCTFGPFAIVARDITERLRVDRELRRHRESLEQQVEERTSLLKEANEALQEQTAGLEAANRELVEFSHVVSHDLRAPLRAIRQYADFLVADLGKALSGEPREFLRDLERSVTFAESLVEDLLTLARVGRPGTPVANLDLGSCVRSTVESFAFDDSVSISMPTDWPSLEVDPTLLQQVLRNLVSNAVKFNDSEKKEVTLSWRQEEGAYVISVADNGIGIPRRYHQRIFGTFERLHTDEEYDGTGIGLPISKKAVEKMNGTIALDSTPGQGSTFCVRLPKRG